MVWHHNEGVRNYLGEFPYSHGLILNEYIKSGDKDLLKELFESDDREAYFYTTNLYNYFVSLYHFLKENGLNHEFKFVCIDLENNPQITLKEMQKILAKYQDSELLKLFEEYKEEFNFGEKTINFSDLNLSMITEEIKLEIKNRGMDEIDKFSLMHMMDNLMNYLTIYKRGYGQTEKYRRRDKVMYNNFLALRDQDPNGRYFGRFGSYHVFQKEYKNINFFGSYLSQNEKIVSLLICYNDSHKLKKNNKIATHSTIDDPLFLRTNYKEHPIYLFHLNRDRSPFKENLMFVKSDPNDNTTDYFQYMFLVNGGRASEPYNKKIYE